MWMSSLGGGGNLIICYDIAWLQKYPQISLLSPLAWLANAAAVLSKTNNTASLPRATTRNPKIMFGFPTRDGEFGWQASLELLHPSLGFIGHWCGGVLIHKYWVLSSAHCIHKWVTTSWRVVRPYQSLSTSSDLFNLPLPALWSVVLGENNRKIESGYEQRIPVDKIIMHEKYRHFKNDLGMLSHETHVQSIT